MSHFRRHVMHAAVENPPFGKAHTDAAVFHQDLASPLLQGRPARLEGQLGVMHLEVQADAASTVGGTFVQRTLILEVALLDGARANRILEPIDQHRAQRRRFRRQVLLGVTRITLAEADAQVHVILDFGIAREANQEIAGDPALLSVDAQIGGGEGERLLIQRPGQPAGAVPIVPGFRIKRRQMQAEIIAVQA